MNKKILSTILILLPLAVVLKSETLAAEDITVAENEVLTGPYIQTGDNIVVRGMINGDAYLLGALITIDGTINGDLLVGGGVVTIKGEVKNDVRAVGGMVTIDGKVGGNVTALGGTVNIGSDADIDGELLSTAGNLAHLGNIDGSVQIYADQATLAGRVGGNIKATVPQLTVAKTAILDQDLNYISNQEASVSAAARISGTIQRTPAGKVLTQVGSRAHRGLLHISWGVNLLSYFSMLLLGVLLLKFTPRQVTAISKLIGKQPWRVMGTGLLVLVLTPLVVFLLIISIVGVPLAVILVVAYALMIGLSSLFTGLFVGQKFFDLTNLKENRYAMLAVGLLLLQRTLALPVVGGFVRILSVTAAIGAIATDARKKLEAK